jgi:hypothetical protein
MPRFYFHIIDGTAFIDTEGVELAGMNEVRRMAVTTAGQMLEQIGERFWEGKPWRLSVADETGVVVATLLFQSEQ